MGVQSKGEVTRIWKQACVEQEEGEGGEGREEEDLQERWAEAYEDSLVNKIAIFVLFSRHRPWCCVAIDCFNV